MLFPGTVPELGPNDIHIWFVRTDLLHSEILDTVYSAVLSESERRQFSIKVNQAQRIEYLVSRLLCRSVISIYESETPDYWQFYIGGFGKPYLLNSSRQISFSVSHTSGLIVCAVSLNCSIGIDTEQIDYNNNVISIAKHVFSRHEIQELMDLQCRFQKVRHFYEIWTLKESLIKAHGKALEIPLDYFRFVAGERNPNMLANANIELIIHDHQKYEWSTSKSWLLYPMKDTHCMAVSTCGAMCPPTNITFLEGFPRNVITEETFGFR